MVKYHIYWTRTALSCSQLFHPGLSNSGNSWSFQAPHSMQCMSSYPHPRGNVLDLLGIGRLAPTLGLIFWSTHSTGLSQCSESTNRSCVRTPMNHVGGLKIPWSSVVLTIYFLPETSWALSLPVQFYLSGASAISKSHILPQQWVLSILLSSCWNTVKNSWFMRINKAMDSAVNIGNKNYFLIRSFSFPSYFFM